MAKGMGTLFVLIGLVVVGTLAIFSLNVATTGTLDIFSMPGQGGCYQLSILPLSGIRMTVSVATASNCGGDYWYVKGTEVWFTIKPGPGFTNPVITGKCPLHSPESYDVMIEGSTEYGYFLCPTAKGTGTGTYAITMNQNTQEYVNLVPS